MSNREGMPDTAAFVDQVREVFPQARLLYAAENGYEVGTRADTERAGFSGPIEIRRIIGETYIGREARVTDEEQQLLHFAIDAAARSVVEAESKRGAGKDKLHEFYSHYGSEVHSKIRERAKKIWSEEGA